MSDAEPRARALRRIAELSLALTIGVVVGAQWCSQPKVVAEQSNPVRAATPSDRSQEHTWASQATDDRSDRAPDSACRACPNLSELQAALVSFDGGPTAAVPESGASCRARISSVAPGLARSARTLSSAVLELTNDCDETVMISWLDFNGAEQGPDFVLPNTTWTSNTYKFHVFRLRTTDARRSFVRDLMVPAARRSRVLACGCGAAPGALAVDVPEVIDAGEPEARLAPRCPVPFDPEPPTPAASPVSSAQVQLKLRNTCEDLRVHLSWVRLDGGPRDAEELEPGVEQDYTSYLGHRFRVYDANTHRWLRDFEIDGGAIVDMCRCPGP